MEDYVYTRICAHAMSLRNYCRIMLHRDSSNSLIRPSELGLKCVCMESILAILLHRIDCALALAHSCAVATIRHALPRNRLASHGSTHTHCRHYTSLMLCAAGKSRSANTAQQQLITSATRVPNLLCTSGNKLTHRPAAKVGCWL
jgi:hypothetical protein